MVIAAVETDDCGEGVDVIAVEGVPILEGAVIEDVQQAGAVIEAAGGDAADGAGNAGANRLRDFRLNRPNSGGAGLASYKAYIQQRWAVKMPPLSFLWTLFPDRPSLRWCYRASDTP